jgi:sensor domain CHASE-containing protein
MAARHLAASDNWCSNKMPFFNMPLASSLGKQINRITTALRRNPRLFRGAHRFLLFSRSPLIAVLRRVAIGMTDSPERSAKLLPKIRPAISEHSLLLSEPDRRYFSGRSRI